jgi:hypothetical protein
MFTHVVRRLGRHAIDTHWMDLAGRQRLTEPLQIVGDR